MVMEENVYGPFPLCHLDLHFKNVLFDDEFNITGLIDLSDVQSVPLERCIISPEFVTFPGLSVQENEPIRRFRAMFSKALAQKEHEQSCDIGTSSSRKLSEMVDTPLSELVYRCVYSYPWRALSDARLVLRLLYGAKATWEQFKAFRKDTCLFSDESMCSSIRR